LRLRCGDYRVFFDQEAEGGMFITAILHRSEAYR
jgi:mRNA-degrading endonuclease RelE of RelBE toxin-antitoxin system